MLRIILAVASAFLVWTTLWLSSNALLASVFPQWYSSDGTVTSFLPLYIGLTNTVLFSLLAGYMSRRIGRTLKAVLYLSVIQFLIGLYVTFQFINTAPLWYHIVFLLLLIPSHLIGGYLAQKQIKRKTTLTHFGGKL